MNAIYQILSTDSFSDEKEKYLDACVRNLKNKTSIPQSLNLIKLILSTYKRQAIFQNNGIRDMLSKCQKEISLLDVSIITFIEYMQVVKQQLQQQDSNNKPQDAQDLAQQVFQGKFSHQQQIEIRLSFLEFINKKQQKKHALSILQLKHLWHHLVLNSITQIEKSKFLEWINKKKQKHAVNSYNQAPKMEYVIGEQLVRDILSNLVTERSLMNNYQIPMDVFNQIQVLFMSYNQFAENFAINDKQIIRVSKFDGILGLNFFWNILMYSDNQEQLKKAKQMVVSCYARHVSMQVSEKKKLWEKF